MRGIEEKINAWDWELFFKTADALGSQFNQASWRMMKGEVICVALEMCSNGDAKYVDEVGYDLLIGDVKVEVKTEKAIIKKNDDTKAIQLKNTRGEVQKINKTFDYLLLANTQQEYKAAIVEWEIVKPNCIKVGDQIQCKLRKEELTFISKYTLARNKKKEETGLKTYMKNGIKKWILDIKNND